MEELSRILVPVDGSRSSDQAVRFAVTLASYTGAAIDILHVSYFDSNTDAEEISWLPESVTKPAGPEAHDILERARKLLPATVHYKIYHRIGSPAETILAFAGRHHSDMIVVGSRRMDTLHAALLGSVSSAVLQEAACPVTVVKENHHC